LRFYDCIEYKNFYNALTDKEKDFFDDEIDFLIGDNYDNCEYIEFPKKVKKLVIDIEERRIDFKYPEEIEYLKITSLIDINYNNLPKNIKKLELNVEKIINFKVNNYLTDLTLKEDSDHLVFKDLSDFKNIQSLNLEPRVLSLNGINPNLFDLIIHNFDCDSPEIDLSNIKHIRNDFILLSKKPLSKITNFPNVDNFVSLHIDNIDILKQINHYDFDELIISNYNGDFSYLERLNINYLKLNNCQSNKINIDVFNKFKCKNCDFKEMNFKRTKNNFVIYKSNIETLIADDKIKNLHINESTCNNVLINDVEYAFITNSKINFNKKFNFDKLSINASKINSLSYIKNSGRVRDLTLNQVKLVDDKHFRIFFGELDTRNWMYFSNDVLGEYNANDNYYKVDQFISEKTKKYKTLKEFLKTEFDVNKDEIDVDMIFNFIKSDFQNKEHEKIFQNLILSCNKHFELDNDEFLHELAHNKLQNFGLFLLNNLDNYKKELIGILLNNNIYNINYNEYINALPEDDKNYIIQTEGFNKWLLSQMLL